MINSQERIQNEINISKEKGLIETSLISDGYHTFDDLYYDRMFLFSIICNLKQELSWKSWLHYDGTMFDDYFIVGITTLEGDFSYHYHKDYWNMFQVPIYDRGKKWDGHESKDITRLLTLI